MTMPVQRLASATAVVRWGQGSHAFEIRSPDEAVLERAAVVFEPWRHVAADALPAAAWTVVPGPGRDEWSIQTTVDPDVVVRGDRMRAVRLVEVFAVQALMDSPRDMLTLHAALVAREDLGVLILGAGESGKSTLAAALWQRGFSLLGDDIAIIDPATTDAAPAPRRVSLRSGSRELVGADLWARILAASSSERTLEGVVFHPQDVDGAPRPRAARLAACVFLNRPHVELPSGVAKLIPAASAVLALLPASNLIRRYEAGVVIERLAPLAARVPAYDLARAPLDAMCAAVETLLEQGRAERPR